MRVRGLVEIALYGLRSAKLAEYELTHPSSERLRNVEREIAAVERIPVATVRQDIEPLKTALQKAAEVIAKTLEVDSGRHHAAATL